MVLGWVFVSYERGTPVGPKAVRILHFKSPLDMHVGLFLGQTRKRDVYYNQHARHVSTPAEDLSEQNLESL